MANRNGDVQTNGAVHTDEAIGLVRAADITQEMQSAYLDYAMSVIVARALPDVRDGLKPVHRRILYAMWHDLSLTHDKPHKKSARIVGEVLGKYHPHGDSAVYDAMVRMAQDFSLRYPLVDGQGNFGSIDGDNAAAMRYTEARLAKISDLMLEDLEKDTVGWHPNFDNTLREPDIIPAALPNLLINGSSGIAVGMATNIPPHNLGEVVDALVYVIDRFDKVDDVTTEELMQFIKGPDFPTGGIVYRYREEGKGEDDADAIAQGYSMGKSRLIMQAKAHFEEISRGRTRIIVTELPYQTNKTALLERIADLVRDEKIEGIADLRDESDRMGMRIVVELTRTVEPKTVLANLFKYTPLQQTFGMQLLALVDGQPRLLSLKRLLQLFVQHRQEIIRRRSEFDLKQARERAHIVEGLLRALDILDEVIHTIRHSQTVDTARKNLVSNFQFTEIQAQAILDMQLRRLAALERKRLQAEYAELKQRIAYLEDLLAHPHKLLGVIKEDLLAIRQEYADVRRTQIVERTRGTLTTHDLLPDQMVWISVNKNGELRRQQVTRLNAALLRQIGKESQAALLTANTRDLLYLFTRDGRCGRVDVHKISDGDGRTAGDLTGFSGKDVIAAAMTLPRERTNGDGGFVFLVTELGDVKRIAVADIQASTLREFPAINVVKGDRLGWALPTQGAQQVILVSAEGQLIRFSEEEVRSMGLPAGGVGGMKLRSKDRLVGAAVVDPAGELITVTAAGFAKRTGLDEFSSQGRNGGGIVAHKLNDRTGKLTAAAMNPAGSREMVLLVTSRGTAKPMPLSDIPVMGRSASGKSVITTADRDVVTAVWRIATGASEPDPTDEPPPRRPDRTKVAAEQPALLDPLRGERRRTAPVKAAIPIATPARPAAKRPPVAPQEVGDGKSAPAPAVGETAASKSPGSKALSEAGRTPKTSTPASGSAPAARTPTATETRGATKETAASTGRGKAETAQAPADKAPPKPARQGQKPPALAAEPAPKTAAAPRPDTSAPAGGKSDQATVETATSSASADKQAVRSTGQVPKPAAPAAPSSRVAEPAKAAKFIAAGGKTATPQAPGKASAPVPPAAKPSEAPATVDKPKPAAQPTLGFADETEAPSRPQTTGPHAKSRP